MDEPLVIPNDLLKKSAYESKGYEWETSAPDENFPAFHRSKFSAVFGMTDVAQSVKPEDTTPLNLWKLYFDDKIIDMLVFVIVPTYSMLLPNFINIGT